MKAKKRPIIGVMGGAEAAADVYRLAMELGERIAQESWILLNGGRDAGVMRASAEGAKKRNGLTIGILPGADAEQANPFIDLAIVTNMGDARNLVNVLSSDVVVACPGGAGTISEAALALKSGKPVILLRMETMGLFQKYKDAGLLFTAESPKECIEKIKVLLMRS